MIELRGNRICGNEGAKTMHLRGKWKRAVKKNHIINRNNILRAETAPSDTRQNHNIWIVEGPQIGT